MFNLIHDGEPGRCEVCGASLSIETGECDPCGAKIDRFIERMERRFAQEGTDFIILNDDDFDDWGK